jgi:tetratricopeptide (TPR) repeat protein
MTSDTQLAATLQHKLNTAVALHQGGELQQAAQLYLQIIEADPHHVDALQLLGTYALQMGDLAAALDLLSRAYELSPGHLQVNLNLGVALQHSGRLEEALQANLRALRIAPGNPDALNNCASVLQAQKQFAASVPYLQQALRLAPESPDALNNMGFALTGLYRFEEALACIDRALDLRPGFLLAWFNRGNALQYLNRLDEACAAYEQALRLDPDHADSRFSLGVCHLLAGRFEPGWQGYAWRWKKREAAALPPYPQPLWRGEQSLQGKTILVYGEQGYGDSIQFCRYARVLAAMGARVLLHVPAPLSPLMKDLEGMEHLVADNAPLPPFDYHCPLLDLGLASGTTLATIPAQRSYLAADPARADAWRARLGPADRPRVGVVWCGNPAHANDAARSIRLVEFARLLGDQVQWVSLQNDVSPVDRLVMAQYPQLRDFSATLTDFAETAALVAQMDLVITVDTSVAHLAAAMGKPVWILLPFAPDWRWMLGRADTPWYPSATLIRQSRPGDWASVLEEVARMLTNAVA